MNCRQDGCLVQFSQISLFHRNVISGEKTRPGSWPWPDSFLSSGFQSITERKVPDWSKVWDVWHAVLQKTSECVGIWSPLHQSRLLGAGEWMSDSLNWLLITVLRRAVLWTLEGTDIASSKRSMRDYSFSAAPSSTQSGDTPRPCDTSKNTE